MGQPPGETLITLFILKPIKVLTAGTHVLALVLQARQALHPIFTGVLHDSVWYLLPKSLGEWQEIQHVSLRKEGNIVRLKT